MKYFSFTLKQLKIIQAIHINNEVNIKTAAKNLYLSQPALSSQIKNLESNICSKILFRKKKQIYFTTEGELILDYANKILQLCQEADKALLYFKKLKKFSLIIGCNKIIGEFILIKLIRLFCKRYSYANVYLKFGCTKSLCWDLTNGKIDIGIIQEDEVPKNLYNSIYLKTYFKEKIALIISRADGEKFRKEVNEETLYMLNFITIKSSFSRRKIIENYIKIFNIKNLRFKLELNSIEAVKYAIQAGLGVSFLSTLYVKDELKSQLLDSVILKNLSSDKNFALAINLKNTESYLSEQFYNYCFRILHQRLYNNFLNLEY